MIFWRSRNPTEGCRANEEEISSTGVLLDFFFFLCLKCGTSFGSNTLTSHHIGLCERKAILGSQSFSFILKVFLIFKWKLELIVGLMIFFFCSGSLKAHTHIIYIYSAHSPVKPFYLFNYFWVFWVGCYRYGHYSCQGKEQLPTVTASYIRLAFMNGKSTGKKT